MSESQHWPWQRPEAESEPEADEAVPEAWVTVYNAANVEEAHIVMGNLEANGIPSMLYNEAGSSLFGAVSLGGVDVQVPAELADQALEVIAPVDGGDEDVDEDK